MSSPLVIRFATDAEGARAAIANLAGSIASNMVTAGTAIRAVNDNIGKLEGSARGLSIAARAAVVGFVAFEAVRFALDQVGEAAKRAEERLEALVKIASQAQSAGVGTTFFQSWTKQAKDLETEVGKLEAMLERAREASTVRIGDGDAGATSPVRDRLRQNVKAGNLDGTALTRFDAADSQEGRIRVILDLIGELQTKGAQLAALDLAGKMFGPEFETKLRVGVDMVGKMRTALDGLKVAGGERIIPPEEIARAEALNKRLEEAKNLLAQGLLPIQQDIARWEQQQLAGWVDIKVQIAEAVALAGRLYTWVKGVADIASSIGSSAPFKALAGFLDRNGLIDRKAQAGLENYLNGGLPADAKPSAPKDNDTGGPLVIDVKGDRSKSLPSLSAPKGGGSAASERLDAVERLINQLEKAAEVAKAELETVGKTNVQREVAVALAKARVAAEEEGRTLTEKEIADVTRLAEATANAKDKALDLNQALRQNAETIRFFGEAGVDALGDILLEAKEFEDVLSSLWKMLARSSLSAIFLGQGPLAGLFGTAPAASAGPNAVGGLLGGLASAFRANGGPVEAGRAYTVGEMGEELFIPDRNGRIVPIERGGAGLLGGGGGHVTHAPTYHIAPAPGVTPEQLAAVIERNNRQFADQLPSLLDRAARRYS